MTGLPPGPYDLIRADPPWTLRVRSDKGKGRNPERHYACMSTEAIAALPVGGLAARDAVLLLWTTWPHLEAGLGLSLVGVLAGVAILAVVASGRDDPRDC